MESSWTAPRPIVFIVEGGAMKLPISGFPVVAQVDTDFPVKFPHMATYVDGQRMLRVTVGEQRALYYVSGADFTGHMICDLLAYNTAGGEMVNVQPLAGLPRERQKELLDS